MPKTEQRASSFSFLRALSADIQGARYQQPVMPFVLLRSKSLASESQLDAAITTSFLSAGALDILHSPIGPEDLDRLVGHVKETVRPPARLVGATMPQILVDNIRNSSTPPKAVTHRPDQTLPANRTQAVEKALSSWNFPAHNFTMDELTYAACFMLEHILQEPELQPYQIPREELMGFLLATRRQYKHDREVHYHNWRHAVDVTQSVYSFLLDVRICTPFPTDHRPLKQLNALEQLMTPVGGLVLLITAIGHDVGHPGVNNAFLVACNHPLAQMYNDKSVLENYHCAAYLQLLRRHWPSLSNVDGMRQTLISTILATDMQRHFEYMTDLGELKRKVDSSETDLSDWSDKDREQARQVIMALLMKAADISNVARPFEVSSRWARILMNEFSRQGELESELNIPTCLFGGPPKRDDVLAAAQSQKGFLSLFGFPLFSGMNEVMPSVSCALPELANNRDIWDQKIEQEKQRRDSNGESAPLTFSSVSKKEVEEAKVRHHHSEPTAVPEQVPQTPSTPVDRVAVIDAETASMYHPAYQQRQHTFTGLAPTDDKRSSAPFLPSLATPLWPEGGSSRRSSKDIALDQMQHPSAYAHSNVSPGSRRGSADASWQIHQSYPGSRRGSKDESLTTILVTSQGSPGRRSSLSLPVKTPRQTGSPGKQSAKRQSVPHSQKQATIRSSARSSQSQPTSSATAATTQHSPSTQSSSLETTDSEPTPPAARHSSVAATADPFLVPGKWPNDLDGTHRASAPEALAGIPPAPGKAAKSGSPRIVARMASGEAEDASGRETPGKNEHGVRESRSRSRLRGLKFWRKKREVSGVEAGESGSP